MISINDDIKSTLLTLEENLQMMTPQLESFQKELIHRVIIQKNKDRYIKRQRRINSLKSPFIRARGVLQGILGESIEEIYEEELIETSILDKEHEVARNILDKHPYPECIEYLREANKNSLTKVNKRWLKGNKP